MGQVVKQDILAGIEKNLKWIVFSFAFLIYANTLTNSWALDDYSVIVNHSHVQSGIDGLSAIFSTNYRNGNSGFNDGLYRPLSLAMFAIEKEFFNSNTTLAHFINVLLYSLGCTLLFLSLKTIFKDKKIIIPFGVCLLFVTHPIHTEVIANIKSRDEILAFLGFTFSLLYALKAIDSKSIKHSALSILGFVIALLSKESAVLFCLIIPLTVYLKQDINWKAAARLLLLFVPLAILFMLLRHNILQGMVNPIDPGNFGLLNNPIAAESNVSLKWGSTLYLQVLFLAKLVFPATLLHDYSFSQIALNDFFSWKGVLGLFTLLGIIATALWGVITKNKLGIATALYGISILIASQIFTPIGIQFAERMLFVSVLPFSILIVLLFEKLNTKEVIFSIQKQKTVLVFTLLISTLYSFKTVIRNSDWKSNLTLYAADAEAGNNSARINYNYGTELNLASQQSNNQNDKREYSRLSIVHLKKAISIYPEYLDAYNNIGLAYKNSGDYASAIKIFRQGIKQNFEYTKYHFNLGTVYLENKQYRKAIKAFQNFVSFNPNADNAYYLMAQSAGYLNEMNEAIGYLNRSIELNPSNAAAYNLLGMAYGMTNNSVKATNAFEKAVQLDPQNTAQLLNLAIGYRNTNQKDKEQNTLKRILQIDPNNVQARNQLNSQ